MVWVNRNKSDMITWDPVETPEIDEPNAALRHNKKTGDDAHDLGGVKNVINRFSDRESRLGLFGMAFYPLIVAVIGTSILFSNIYIPSIFGGSLLLYFAFKPLKSLTYWLAARKRSVDDECGIPVQRKKSKILSGMNRKGRFISSAPPSAAKFASVSGIIATSCLILLVYQRKSMDTDLAVITICATSSLILIYWSVVIVQLYSDARAKLLPSRTGQAVDADFPDNPKA